MDRQVFGYSLSYRDRGAVLASGSQPLEGEEYLFMKEQVPLFVRIGALTYYRWNLFASLNAYIALELLIYAQYCWYTGPMRNTARPHEAPED